MTEQVKDAIASLRHLVECRCDEAYTGRSRHDPYSACDYADEVKIVTDHIEKLAAQLKMVLEREAETQARHDSKLDALEVKLARAVEGLQFYTEGADYEYHRVTRDCGCCSDMEDPIVLDDKGRLARLVLSEIEKETK